MQQLLRNPIVLIVMALMTLGLGMSLHRSVSSIDQSDSALEEAQRKTNEQKVKLSIIQEKLEQARKPISKERTVRNELLYQKPGEYVMQIPDVVVSSPSPIPVAATPTPWEAWQSVLIGAHRY